MAEIRDAVKGGDSVYIGEKEYYVCGTNKFFANLYSKEDLDSLPDVVGSFPTEYNVDWQTLAQDPFDLTMAINGHRLPVTDYFLDIEDFREAVITNPRNSTIIEKMGLPVPERDDPVIPLIQTNGSPYYTTGDRVFLDNDRECLIKAVADRYVWYAEMSAGTETTDTDEESLIRIAQRDFDSQFFRNPLNNVAILRGRESERGEASQSQTRGDSPVFYGSPEEDSEAFRESHKRNMECVDALKNAFRRHFDENRLNTEAVIEDIKEFSAERISVVLANTMRTREGDGRFSSANRKWQESVTLPESSYMYYTAVDSHSILVDHLVATLSERRAPDRQAVGAADPDAAYWAHYRDIAEKSSGDLDYSRIDAKIGVRMRTTDHTPDQVQSAIEKNAPAMRGETMDAVEFDAKYKNRDWRRYAAETTENYVFGARGAIQFEKDLSDRPNYMRIEGRNLQEEERIRRESERQDKEHGRGR